MALSGIEYQSNKIDLDGNHHDLHTQFSREKDSHDGAAVSFRYENGMQQLIGNE